MSLFFSVFFESKCTQNDAVVTVNVASKKPLSRTDLGIGGWFLSVFFESRCTQNDAAVSLASVSLTSPCQRYGRQLLLLLPPLLLSRTDLKGTMSLFFGVFFESKCTQNDAVVTVNVASKKPLSRTDLNRGLGAVFSESSLSQNVLKTTRLCHWRPYR